jgi:ABC-type uncharacterized transport system substrate-binding protein
MLDDSALLTYTADVFEVGKQIARLASQIHRGALPADLPVEAAESSVTINLKTAQMISLDISDDVLKQTGTIIR